jgi:hypothetical protein
MKSMSKRAGFCGALASALLTLTPLAASAADNTCAGVSMPASAKAFGEPLVRNGVGVRQATFLNVDVYVAGLYLENGHMRRRDRWPNTF